MRVLVLTSCTGEKAVESNRALTLADFQQGIPHIVKRERELNSAVMPAGEMYTGQQHVRLMHGINGFRESTEKNDGKLDLYILSAGYGLISEERKIAPYEMTFATMRAKELRKWADSLDVPREFRKSVLRPYDLGLILFGDNYLLGCAMDSSIQFGGPTLLFCGKRMANKLPRLRNMRVVTLSNSEATRFSCGLVALKGELARRLLKRLTNEPEFVSRIMDPTTDVLALFDEKQIVSTNQKQTRSRSVPNAKVDYIIKIPQSWWNKEHRKKFRYFIPEWDDLVDPDYDFINDTHSGGSGSWENEVYAHQLYPKPNYDGLLMSRAVAEKSESKKKRINALGVHRMLRVPKEFPVMGDCGAFNYIMEDKPPYSTEDVLDYYTRLDFDMGVSVDHLIVTATEHKKKFRYDLTIQNAEDFLKQHRKAGLKWTPIGAIQGWDAGSYAKAAQQYVKMGYRCIGLGGLVRSQTRDIMTTLRAVRNNVPNGISIHLFGLARLNAIKEMADLGVTSVDSASPLRRAWLGGKDNYWTLDGKHYRAIRVPEAGKSFRAKRMVAEGRASSAFVEEVEKRLMKLLRSFDAGKETIENVLEVLAEYDHLITRDRSSELVEYRRTLEAQAWKECSCNICRRDGIEVLIFRGNNRNRRRGFHNVYVFYRMMQGIINGTMLPPVKTRDIHALHPQLALGV